MFYRNGYKIAIFRTVNSYKIIKKNGIKKSTKTYFTAENNITLDSGKKYGLESFLGDCMCARVTVYLFGVPT